MIYFIRHGNTDYIKIGYSRSNPMRRMSLLQCGNPIELKMIGTAHGEVIHEKRLHRMMADKRVSGEWYHADQEFNHLMTSVLLGMFDWTKPEKRGPKKKPDKTIGPKDITFASALFHHVAKLCHGELEYVAMMPQNAIDAWHKGMNKTRPNWKHLMAMADAKGIDWRDGAPSIYEILPPRS